MRKQHLRRISFVLVLALFVGLLIPAIPVSAAQPELTQGQKNIVKRARQMTEIQWTPQKDIVGWDWGVTYRAGVTYTGLPYGQPLDASYVPWTTSLEGFQEAVNNPNSLMYTDFASSKRAPYYSIDCSAFVSWAWNLKSRQSTHSIAQFATAISTSSYEDAQVGDCLNKYAEHVVLITDIDYDAAGTINSIEISEATTVKATNYCCQVVRYGVGGSKTLSEFKTKYFGNGYTLYRSKTRESVTYEHSCAVPLEGDVCAKCGIGGYLAECISYPCALKIKVTEDCCPYTQPCNPTTASELGYTSEKLISKPISKGEILTADALYKNTEGNYWYRVTLSDGTKAYLYSTHTTKSSIIYPWVDGGSFPSSITGTTNLQGTVMSGGSRLDTVQAIVCRQGTTNPILTSNVVTVNAASYPLKNSTVDKTMVFGDLSQHGTGNYTLKIDTAFTTYYADGNELESTGLCAYAASYDFYYGSAVHTCNKGTYLRQRTAHPHYSEYECSICGEVWTATDEPNYWDSCTECNPEEPPVDQTVYRGIDVSHHQGAIDWDTVAPNIDFAIVRCGYGEDMTSQDDRYWKANADACTRLGIPFGVYIYSYAETDEQARSEAEHVLRLVEGYEISLPIYLDLEEEKLLGKCTKEDFLRHAQIFCDIIEEAGYQAGVYANYNWWTNYLTDPAYDQWSRWIARYASATGYHKDYDMWQYSSTGSVPGISGNVDMNYWYGALPGTEHIHSYDASVTKSATCTEDGVITYTCRCGDTYTERIESTGHDYLWEYVDANCVMPGHTVYTCTICADTYTVYDDYGAWSEEKPAGVDENLIESKTQYRYSEYETTTSYEPNMPGWDQRSSSWQQSENGSISYVKNWPSGFLTSHSLYSAYNKSPKSASETTTDKTVINSDNTTGYLYYHWCRGTYTAGPINRGSKSTRQGEFTAFHAFYSTTNPNTLTADSDGSVIYSNGDCCKDSYWYFHTPVNTQTYTTYKNLFTYERWSSWSDWSDTQYTATDRRKVETRTLYRMVTGELGDHEWDAGVVTTEAGCTTAGIKVYTCIHCGETYEDSYGEPLGHNLGNWNTVVEATCTQDGSERRDCTRCDHHETRVKQATGHRYSGIVIDPTCTQQGYTIHSCHCGESYVDTYVPALGHAWDAGVVTVEPTEDAVGEMTYTCERCAEIRTEVIPVLGHEHRYEAVVTAPNCTEQGYTTHSCHCGDSYIDSYTPALGHQFSEWLIIQNPSNNSDGLEIRTCMRCGHEERRTIAKYDNPFVDVPEGSFYYEPVLWAVAEGITNGTSATTFGPNDPCMRAHVVTFLWRAAGSPDPVSDHNPFVDVKVTDFYYKAVLWAVEEGITNGLDATHFGPTTYCNRAQVVTFLWRAQGNPEPNRKDMPFADVAPGAFYEKPVLWAVENSITNGMSATIFGINEICNRAQIVTFLYRTYN